jgi:hypothetical protein
MGGISVSAAPIAYIRRPPDYGLLAWDFDPSICASTTTLGSAGTLQLQRVHVPVTSSVTNIVMYLGTVAVGGTSGQNFAGLWNASGGAQVGITADMTATFGGSGGLKVMALASGPFLIAAGDYYVGYYWNAGTSGPGWARANTIAGTLTNMSLASPDLICATANTGLTTTPPSTLGAQSINSHNWWCGLS